LKSNVSSPVPDLKGKTVFVSGAGGGMGRTISAAVLELGGNVVSLEINPESIKAAVNDLDAGDRLAFHEGSVATKADVEAAFALAAQRFGQVHHLVNCAGVAPMSRVMDTPEEEWDWVVDTCMKGPFLCTQAFARQAIAGTPDGCTIVNISSLNAVAVSDGLGPYSAAKAGLKTLGEVWAWELGNWGIRVNSVGPGTTVTPMSVMAREGKFGQSFLDKTLLKPVRHQEASDIADVILYLMSPAAQRITGHYIPVDGGQHVQGLFSYWEVAREQFGHLIQDES
jgi:3-oxoacyl-[acyl-carrier protein] reductase